MTSIQKLLVRLLGRSPPSDASYVHDDELLRRFHTQRDQAAFELLVWRHGGLVWGVCHRMIRDHHLSEDAFQATFLILARKGQSIRGTSCAGWLHQVARRVALRLIEKQSSLAAVALTDEVPDTVVHQELKFLDSEIAALPERFRQPLILCYLQQYTTDEAAQVLGIPRGTVLSRLSTARDKLSKRLTRHGIAMPVLAVVVLTADHVAAVAQQSTAWPGTLLPGSAYSLAHEVLTMMTWKPLATAAVVLIACASLGGIAIVSAKQGGRTKPTNPPEAVAKESEKKAVSESKNVTNRAEKIRLLINVTEKQLQNLRNQKQKIFADSNNFILKVNYEIAIEEYQQLIKARNKVEREIIILEMNIDEAKASNENKEANQNFIERESVKLSALKRSLRTIDRQKALYLDQVNRYNEFKSVTESIGYSGLDQKINSLQKLLSELEYLQLMETIDPEHRLPMSRELNVGSDDGLRNEMESIKAEVEKLRKAIEDKK